MAGAPEGEAVTIAYAAELWALSNLYGKPISYFAPDK
jgi:hypothetical protein